MFDLPHMTVENICRQLSCKTKLDINKLSLKLEIMATYACSLLRKMVFANDNVAGIASWYWTPLHYNS